jgi:extradiol dioxygenase family protein
MKIAGVTHWSIPVNDIAESERFYGEVMGLKMVGRLGNGKMTCFNVGDHNILLCQRDKPASNVTDNDGRVHHSFHVASEDWEEAVRELHKEGVALSEPIVYREKGYFTGREIYVFDPSGNCIEIRDPNWKPGMPTPTYEEIVAAEPTPA